LPLFIPVAAPTFVRSACSYEACSHRYGFTLLGTKNAKKTKQQGITILMSPPAEAATTGDYQTMPGATSLFLPTASTTSVTDTRTAAGRGCSAAASWLLDHSPSGNPTLWLWINGICCLASLLLLLELIVFEEGPIDALEYGLPLYAVYNFGTCATWCVESVLELWYSWQQHHHHNHNNKTNVSRNYWELVVQAIFLLAAVYFLVTSLFFLHSLRTVAPDEMEESTRDVFISFVLYLLAVVYTWWYEQRREPRRRRHDEYQSPDDDEDAAMYRSYQII
jgi:hypothetical protein